MAKQFVKVSLATKLRVLLTAAVLLVIASALVVPWYFMELLAQQRVLDTGQEVIRLRLAEWQNKHQTSLAAASDEASQIVDLYSSHSPSLKGPYFISLGPDMKPSKPLDETASEALKTLSSHPQQELVFEKQTESNEAYRLFKAVRAGADCTRCHDATRPPLQQFQPGQLVAMVDVTLPPSAEAGSLVWWTRGAFVVGTLLATALAFVLFVFITQRVILRPIRRLRDLADKVAEGDMSVRSKLRTGDELQRLGESFNEMLDGINHQQDQLRSANRALDLRLHELGEGQRDAVSGQQG